jgi:hypothetical protein
VVVAEADHHQAKMEIIKGEGKPRWKAKEQYSYSSQQDFGDEICATHNQKRKM